MHLKDIAIADGKVKSVKTSMMEAELIFVDWKDVSWRLTFIDVFAVENLNIEGEELDRLAVVEDHRYIERVRSLVDEPEAKMNMYMFFVPWKNEPRLSVVAGGCVVNYADEPPPSL